MQSNRRKPVCHTCQGYMEGHKRVGGSPVCPTPDKRVLASASPGRSLISPPPSPSRQISSGSSAPLTNRSYSAESTGVEACNQLKFEHLPGGGYRRRNPNWESGLDFKPVPQQFQPHPHTPYRGYRAPSPAASLVSTVLVDQESERLRDLVDIDTISDVSSDDDAFGSSASDSSGSMDGRDLYPDTPLGRQSSFVARIADYARFNKSMVTIFRAKGNEVPRIEKETRRRGVYTATMSRSTSGASSSRGHPSPIPTGDRSMLVVLGKSPEFVEEVAARAQELYKEPSAEKVVMPGTLTRNPSLEGPRMVTFFQMFLIAAFTSVFVVYGISLIS